MVDENSRSIYLITAYISWEEHSMLRDINLYSDDIKPYILRKGQDNLNELLDDDKTTKKKILKKNMLLNDETDEQENTNFVEESTLLDEEKEESKSVKKKKKLGYSDRVYTCLVCHVSFDRSRKLTRHRNERNDCQELFTCTICSKTFRQKSNLNTHLKRHRCKWCKTIFL